jgi:DNA-binding CsgD family transcriptional regulator
VTSLTTADPRDLPMLAPACSAGFDKLSYSIDVLDGEIDPPAAMIGVGLSLEYMQAFLPRLTDDPLRRRIACGDVPVGVVPVVFENTGDAVQVNDLSLPGDPGLLGWCLQEGVRTGVAFRIPLDRGRCGSVNMYSARRFSPAELEAALPAVFLAGCRAHSLLSTRLPRSRPALLSRREAECLEALARGVSNGQIARDLGLSIDTVKEYVRSLYRKLKVSGRAEAVAKGHALNYFD